MPGTDAIPLDLLSDIFKRDIHKPHPTYNDLWNIVNSVIGDVEDRELGVVVTGSFSPDGTVGKYLINNDSGDLYITLDASVLANTTIDYYRTSLENGYKIIFQGPNGTELMDYELLPADDVLQERTENVTVWCNGTDFFIL